LVVRKSGLKLALVIVGHADIELCVVAPLPYSMAYHLTKCANSRVVKILDSRFDDVLAVQIKQRNIMGSLHILLLEHK